MNSFLKTPLLILVLGLVLAAPSLRASAESDVIATDRKRVTALIDADKAGLEAVLADDLTYGHADGRLQTKTELLSALTSGVVKYEVYDGPTPSVRINGNTALLSGTAHLQASARGEKISFSLRYLAIYQLSDGIWKLTAYQSTPLVKAN